MFGRFNYFRNGRVFTSSYLLILLILLFTIFNPSIVAADQPPDFTAAQLTPDSISHGGVTKPTSGDLTSIIVRFDDGLSLSSLPESTSLAVQSAQVSHRYEKVFNGVSMIVPKDSVANIAGLPGVAAVYKDRVLELHTERSPQFIGANSLWNELGGQGSAGEGIIVGVLDTGVWPEHPSYSDPDPFGNPYSAPPVIPGSNGFGSGGPRSTCDFGNIAFNPLDTTFICNNKLIGAYNFTDSYKAMIGLLPSEYDSARDADGHGTHTSSTAAGNGGVDATVFGVSRGQVSGIAPRAHVIMYKVCGATACLESDSVAAVEQAILDGVDVINYSISGGNSPYSDVVELAFLDAYDDGIFVAASAGNTGPGPDTVNHRGPWVTTVGASTIDRQFSSDVTLKADNGDVLNLVGASITAGTGARRTPVLASGFGDGLCVSPFAPGTFNGEIVICERGVVSRVAKSFNVSQGGAGGMILYNPALQGISTDNHYVPSIHLEEDEGNDLLNFMSTHTGIQASFPFGDAAKAKGDVMASFSSRGGANQPLGVSKPDITAPGVQILAGHTAIPFSPEQGSPGELFQAIQGTSMSSPHVAGASALLKALHPNWTPGEIKSALMTTAINRGVVKEDGSTPSDPFDLGSGRINLEKAFDPGLTFDETAANYQLLEDELFNSNYPSLYVPVMPGKITVPRTVHDETGSNNGWQLNVNSPPDVSISASLPRNFTIPANGDISFDISVDARNVPLGEVRHASIELRKSGNQVHFPITIVRGQSNVNHVKTCNQSIINLGETTDCTITITNNDFSDANVNLTDRLPQKLGMVPGSVVGATELVGGLLFNGTLLGATPPPITASVGSSPGGYVPLSSFFPPITGMTDESIIHFTAPPFEFAGQTWNAISMVSNGYLIAGGGTDNDITFNNQQFPDATIPNNVLAPFWTDLDPSAGGLLYAGILTSTPFSWLVFEWESVPNFGDGLSNTFQAWIGLNGVEDISFVYGPDLSSGDGGLLTVGAENDMGNSGDNFYFNGTGTLPTANFDAVVISSTPGTPGETHTITFTAEGIKSGDWQNCSEMKTNIFHGTNTACFSGSVN